mmetsp:Transcript_1069/g.4422  ORF Transcript_1069/g.4422 Transcript_1069/m.4422 type:complete len:220 (-) Transcript_1069:77-736(-)
MRGAVLVDRVAMMPEGPGQMRFLLEPPRVADLLIGQPDSLQALPHSLVATPEGPQARVHAHARTAADEQRVAVGEPRCGLRQRMCDLITAHVRVQHVSLVQQGATLGPDKTIAHDEHLELLPRPELGLQRQGDARIRAFVQDDLDLAFGQHALLRPVLDHDMRVCYLRHCRQAAVASLLLLRSCRVYKRRLPSIVLQLCHCLRNRIGQLPAGNGREDKA